MVVTTCPSCHGYEKDVLYAPQPGDDRGKREYTVMINNNCIHLAPQPLRYPTNPAPAHPSSWSQAGVQFISSNIH